MSSGHALRGPQTLNGDERGGEGLCGPLKPPLIAIRRPGTLHETLCFGCHAPRANGSVASRSGDRAGAAHGVSHTPASSHRVEVPGTSLERTDSAIARALSAGPRVFRIPLSVFGLRWAVRSRRRSQSGLGGRHAPGAWHPRVPRLAGWRCRFEAALRVTASLRGHRDVPAAGLRQARSL